MHLLYTPSTQRVGRLYLASIYVVRGNGLARHLITLAGEYGETLEGVAFTGDHSFVFFCYRLHLEIACMDLSSKVIFSLLS